MKLAISVLLSALVIVSVNAALTTLPGAATGQRNGVSEVDPRFDLATVTQRYADAWTSSDGS
ncbi:MAG: hypothetical protein ACR2PQ_13205, partial [Myxococcota bacterium]